jgi:hypothetical protein
MGSTDEVADAAHVETPQDIEKARQLQPDDYATDDVQKTAHRLDDPEWLQAQKRYLRKLDWMILPVISSLYFFEYLDRGNIGVRQPLTQSTLHSQPLSQAVDLDARWRDTNVFFGAYE